MQSRQVPPVRQDHLGRLGQRLDDGHLHPAVQQVLGDLEADEPATHDDGLPLHPVYQADRGVSIRQIPLVPPCGSQAPPRRSRCPPSPSDGLSGFMLRERRPL